MSDNDLDCLSDKDKAIISDYYNGEDKESIAKANEMTLNALYIHIHRIRKKLAVSARKANKLMAVIFVHSYKLKNCFDERKTVLSDVYTSKENE